MNCALDNTKSVDGPYWSLSTIRSFSEKVNGKIVTLTFKSKADNIFNVDMFLKTVNISQFLLEQGLAMDSESEMSSNDLLPNGSPKIELQSSKFVRPMKIPCNDGMEYELEVTTIFSPYCFFAQLLKDKNKFLDFEDKLQEFYANPLPDLILKRPRVGQMCIAKYSVDEAWYRAVIKETDYDSRSVKVFFIDYGRRSYSRNVMLINGMSWYQLINYLFNLR